MKNKVHINSTIRIKVKEEAKKIAKELGMTFSLYLDQAVEQANKKYKKTN